MERVKKTITKCKTYPSTYRLGDIVMCLPIFLCQILIDFNAKNYDFVNTIFFFAIRNKYSSKFAKQMRTDECKVSGMYDGVII